MIQILIDFDELTKKIVRTTILDEEGKRPRQRKKKDTDNSEPILQVDTNKLIISDALLDLIDADAGDRIAINYYTISNTETFPLIGKSEMFADKQSGNKLTKSNTVSFKGVQREILLKYGSLFTVEPFNEGIYKLISLEPTEEVLATEYSELEQLDEEIDEFILNDDEDEDDLPF